MRLWLSANSSLETLTDTLLTDSSGATYTPVAALSPGTAQTGISMTRVIPPGTPVGSYYLIAQADASGVVPALNDNNNTSTRVISVVTDTPQGCTTAAREVSGAASWQDTGIGVPLGAQVFISVPASDTWLNGGVQLSAAGDSANIMTSLTVPLTGGPFMSLAGRIGVAGSPFLAGLGTVRATAATGNLYFAPNDEPDVLWDNGGSLTASITVCTGDLGLAKGVPKPGAIFGASQEGQWNYYYVDVPSNVFNLSVVLDGLTEDADLYVRSASKPDGTDFDCRPYLGSLGAETCWPSDLAL